MPLHSMSRLCPVDKSPSSTRSSLFPPVCHELVLTPRGQTSLKPWKLLLKIIRKDTDFHIITVYFWKPMASLVFATSLRFQGVLLQNHLVISILLDRRFQGKGIVLYFPEAHYDEKGLGEISSTKARDSPTSPSSTQRRKDMLSGIFF